MSEELYRASIRRLRSGVVPDWELDGLSVGYGAARTKVQTNLKALRAGGPVPPLFVSGEWGTGKTHFLSYARASATCLNIPSALVSLNASSAALNYPQRFYTRLVQSIRLADNSDGLRHGVFWLLDDKTRRARFKEFTESGNAGELKEAFRFLYDASKSVSRLDVTDNWAFTQLLGGDISWADYGYKRERALNRLEIISSMLHAVGLGGLVLMLDEAETIDQLWNVRSRATAYTVLDRLFQMRSVWTVVGVTARFSRVLDGDQGRVAGKSTYFPAQAQHFLRKWRQGEYRVFTPPSVGRAEAIDLADRVAQLYQKAYPDVPTVLAPEALAAWSSNSSLNPRRLVRIVVDSLDRARLA